MKFIIKEMIKMARQELLLQFPKTLTINRTAYIKGFVEGMIKAIELHTKEDTKPA